LASTTVVYDNLPVHANGQKYMLHDLAIGEFSQIFFTGDFKTGLAQAYGLAQAAK